MKAMKKVVGVVLALMMVMGMSATVFAAGPSISVKEGDIRSYDIYQIFTGDFATKEGKEVLSNVKWGKNGTGTEGEAVPKTVLTELSAVVSATDIAKLTVIKKYANLTEVNKLGAVSAGNPLNVVPGYYLYVDKGAVGKGESYSLYVVEVVGGNVTIEPKIGTVTSDKKVKDINDSEDATIDDNEWQDSADYDIGDAVPFQLTGTVPANYDNYTTYYYAFHDKQAAGLTFNEKSVVVKVDGNKITEGFTVKTEGLTDGDTFEVVFADLKKIDAVTAGSVITVEYTSTLNNQAAMGAAGNSNEMYLEYTNNPNVIQNPETATGTTPEDKVVVFTYKLVANKIDQDKEPLKGAGFTLYKYDASVEGEDKYVAVDEEITGTDITTFEWNGLDDGNYKLVETTTPAGYNTMKPMEFTISSEHSVDGIISLTAAGFTPDLDEGSLTADIVNNPGSTLPSTGGMGTTILYIAGAVLILGAGAALVMRRRRAEEN